MEAIRLQLLDKKSYKDISKSLGRSPNTIRAAVNELAARNATGLKEYGPSERMVLLNKAFEKCEWLFGSCTDEIRFEKLVNAMRTLMEIRQSIDNGQGIPAEKNLSLNIILNNPHQNALDEDVPDLHNGAEAREQEVDGEVVEEEDKLGWDFA